MKKILYPGTFDPITLGHLDLIKRASKMADELVIGIIKNPSKLPMFALDQRMEMLKLATEDMENVKLDCFSGLLTDYVKYNKIEAVVRGLRSSMDFEYEIQMAQINATLHSDFETLFLMTDSRYSFISSSVVKEIFLLNGEIKNLVSDKIYDYMLKNK